MNDAKREQPSLDPANLKWNGRLWLRVRTAGGIRLLFNWRKIGILLVLLTLAGWLAGAGALWAFVRYKRNVETVRFLDIAFLPLRLTEYRQSLSRHYFALAEKQLAAGTWNQAVFNLRQAVAKDPHHVDARRTLAEMFAHMQRSDLALRTLEDGLDRGKTDTRYLNLLFTLLEQREQAGRIISLGLELLPAQPDSEEIHREIAHRVINAQMSRRAFADARQLAHAWFSDQPPELGILLARIDATAGFLDLAILQLEELYRANPGHEALALHLVRFYQQAGRLPDARRVAAMRVLQRPNSPGAACDLIALLLETGETAAAQRELDAYFGKFAHDERALLLLANSAQRLKLPGLARQVRANAPRDDYGRTKIAFLLAEMNAECLAGNFAAALALQDELSRHTPLDPANEARGLQLRIWASYASGLNAEAEAALNQYLNLNHPTYGPESLGLVERLQTLRLHAPARRILQTLLERNPDNRPALLALVDHDLRQEAWPEVGRRLPQLLAMDPPPLDLLQSVWQQGRDRLVLPPEIRDRLRNLAE